MKNILKRILPKFLKIFIIEHRYMFKVLKSNYKKELNRLLCDNNSSLIIDDKNKWIKKLNRLAYSNLDYIELGKEFMKSKISILKEVEILNNDIVLICVEKNDLIKLKEFINHHRKLGVDKFIILDNYSSDKTVDYLLKQEDVFLLQTKIPYSSIRRVAWINRIIAYFGDNRWYLVLDSDELLVYSNYENKSIKDVIKFLENKNIVRARSIMIDMYAKGEYYYSGDINNFLDECIYYDKDTYYQKDREDYINICGGPRERVFNMSPCLTKYPLFYFRKNDMYCRSHYFYPYKENFKSKCQLAILHYKFLPGEINKYKKIVKDENYFRGSWAYKEYLKVILKDKKLNFMYKDTCKFKNSSSLDNINVYTKINWNDR